MQAAWVPCADHGFRAVKVLRRDGKNLECEDNHGQPVTVSALQLAESVRIAPQAWEFLRDGFFEPVDDLVHLAELNEPTILHTLTARFDLEAPKIYTAIGDILVSLNPFQWIEGLYDDARIDFYSRLRYGEPDVPPHVFNVAQNALLGVRERGRDQAVVISGESGAGKTEATKQCLRYFARVAGAAPECRGVEGKILSANPILEAFGNAKTLRNNNSSRFGKWIEVHFSAKAQICGCRIVNYLLEKSRLVGQQTGERNYHVFYQLCAGATPAQTEQYELRGAEDFLLLAGGQCVAIEGTDDARDFGEVMDAMDALAFTPGEQDDLLRLTAGVLHLGEVLFQEEDLGRDGCGVREAAQRDLGIVARLLGVDGAALAEAMCFRHRVIAGSTILSPVDVEQAEAARNSLIKALYGRMFDWLVDHVNDAMPHQAGAAHTIGVLDIFGFEVFEENSFEQLCINYANEKLQQLFNRSVFKAEEDLYREQGVPIDPMPFVDNQGILELLEKKPFGLLIMLDEEVKLPRGSDASFLSKAVSKHNWNDHFVGGNVRHRASQFAVKHYAGTVLYDSTDFLHKNRDQLQDALAALMGESTVPFVGERLFPKQPPTTKKGTPKARRPTQGAQFRAQLETLMATLYEAEPHYIRCIKPNAAKQPGAIDGGMVLEQLRYSGTFEAVKIRNAGYPFRMTHADFVHRFRVVALALLAETKAADFRARAELIVRHAGLALDGGGCHVGHSMVLYKAAHHTELEQQRRRGIERATVPVQRVTRGFLVRRRVARLHTSRVLLAAALASPSIAALDRALDEARDLWFPIPEVERARAMRARLVEQARVTAELERVADLDPLACFDDMGEVLAAADACELAGELVARVRLEHENTGLFLEFQRCLAEGEELLDSSRLEKALALLGDFPGWRRASGDAVARAETLVAELAPEERFVARVAARVRAQGALRLDAAGGLDRAAAAAEPLVAPARELEEFGVRGHNGRCLLRGVAALYEVRAAVAAGDWPAVEVAVFTAPAAAELDAQSAAELETARQGLAHRREVASTLEELDAAVAECAEERLRAALRACARLTVDRSSDEDVQRRLAAALELLRRVARCHKALAFALAQPAVPWPLLRAAVADAAALKLDSQPVREAAALVARADALSSEGADAARQLDQPLVVSVLRECDELGVAVPIAEPLRSLAALSPRELLQRKLGAALARGDTHGAVLATMQLKRGVSGGKDWRAFAGLRPAKLWARGGRPLASLTRLPPDSGSGELALRLYDCVERYCTPPAPRDGAQLADDVVRLVRRMPLLRDELFCQLMLVAEDGDADMAARANELLRLALSNVPPSDALEDYVDAFLRARKDVESLYAMHRTAVRAVCGALPTAGGVERPYKGLGKLRATIEWEGLL